MRKGFFKKILFFAVLPFLLQVCGSALQLSPSTQSQQEFPSLSKALNVRWRYDNTQTLNLTPAISGGSVYLPLAGGTLISLRVSDGALNWRTELGGDISAAPVADERGVYLASETSSSLPDAIPHATGALRALGYQSGVTLWMRTLQAPIKGEMVSSQTTLFGGASDGRFYAVKKESGEILWVKQHTAPFSSRPLINGERLYVGDEEGNVLVLEAASGRTIWRYRTRAPVRAPLAMVAQTIFVGSADNYVYALNASDGRLVWRVKTGASVQSVALTSNGLLVTSLDNFVYCFSLHKGLRLWKRQLAGRIAAQPLAAGDNVLLAPLAGDECVVLDLHDGKKVNSLPVGEDNNTGASPVLAGNLLLLTTREGLIAFTDSLVANGQQ